MRRPVYAHPAPPFKEYVRAHGDTLCVCGAAYRTHPYDFDILGWPDDTPFLHVLCDGLRVKL